MTLKSDAQLQEHPDTSSETPVLDRLILALGQGLRRADGPRAWDQAIIAYMGATGGPLLPRAPNYKEALEVATRMAWGIANGYRRPPPGAQGWPACNPEAMTWGEKQMLRAYLNYTPTGHTGKGRHERAQNLAGWLCVPTIGPLIDALRGQGRQGMGFADAT